MNFIKGVLFIVVIGGANGIKWLWCKATGKHFESFGGAQ